jgi:hypothetical protein
MVADLAIEDHRVIADIAKRQESPAKIPPLSLYFHYHAEIARIVEKRPLTAADIQRLAKDMEELYAATPGPPSASTATTKRVEK